MPVKLKLSTVKKILKEGQSTRRCAYCKYWYDPTNGEATLILGLGLINKSKCWRRNVEVPGVGLCEKFESIYDNEI